MTAGELIANIKPRVTHVGRMPDYCGLCYKPPTQFVTLTAPFLYAVAFYCDEHVPEVVEQFSLKVDTGPKEQGNECSPVN